MEYIFPFIRDQFVKSSIQSKLGCSDSVSNTSNNIPKVGCIILEEKKIYQEKETEAVNNLCYIFFYDYQREEYNLTIMISTLYSSIDSNPRTTSANFPDEIAESCKFIFIKRLK